jgi:hypothetical protein
MTTTTDQPAILTEASGGIPTPKPGQRWPRRGYKIWWEPSSSPHQPYRARYLGLSGTGRRRLAIVRLPSGAICDDIPVTQIRRRWL